MEIFHNATVVALRLAVLFPQDVGGLALDALLVVWHTPITDTDAEVAGLVLSVEAVLVAYRKLVAVTP